MRRRPTSRTPEAALLGTRLTLDATTSDLRVAHLLVPDAVVVTFWMQFSNETDQALRDVRLVQGAFTDDAGAVLDYDEPPVTIVGSAGRVAAGAGFVSIARYTARGVSTPHWISNGLRISGGTGTGTRFSGSTTLRVALDPARSHRR